MKFKIDESLPAEAAEVLRRAGFLADTVGEIVRSNWSTFADTFNSQAAFTKIMTSLNMLRGPIAHSSPLAEDEVLRLQLTLKDWFRLMQ